MVIPESGSSSLPETKGGKAPGGLVLITDVGSTTTKGLLLRRTADEGYRIEAMAETPTTVELPMENVCLGVAEVVRKLEEATGEMLSGESGMPSIPYLTTSSAGGGLQMLVFGLTSVETGRIAENTAFGAGGIVLRTITVDDELSAIEKMIRIQELHPDIILMAGGTDGGDIAGVVRLAELLMLADPVPKYREGRIPLVYCGNTEARPFVTEVLEKTFELHMEENVRPDLDRLNTGPARSEVHRLFMDSVMERAPGYSVLKEHTVSDILPTPAAVDRILGLYSSAVGGNTALVDIGGATTDIFTRIDGEGSRTVAANTGVSYSISNVLAEVGLDRIMEFLPASFNPASVREYIYNKSLAPTYITVTEAEGMVERAAALAGTAEAWHDHLTILRKNSRVGFLDRRKRMNRKEFDDVFESGSDLPFKLADIGTIIGAGGVISRAGGLEALRMLAEAFLPSGITRICIDRSFRSPHMGVLSTIDEQGALRLFEDAFLQETGFVVAPDEGFREGEPALEIVDEATGDSWTVSWGTSLLLPRGGELRFHAPGAARLGAGSDEKLTTLLPVLIDCRGRGRHFSGRPLDINDPAWAGTGCTELRSPLQPQRGAIEHGPWEIEFRLPYDGITFVNPGDQVESGTILGENRFDPPRLFILDLNRIPGYDRHLTPEEVRCGLLVTTGDRVELNQALYNVRREGIGGFDFVFRSPVRGMLTRVERNGLLILREIQDYDGEPHEVDVAGPLGISPRHIRGCLKFKVGDFVGGGRTLASDLTRGVFVNAPTSGILRKVNTKTGTVTIQYEISPTLLRSHVRGRVLRVLPGRSVTVVGTGATLRGVTGFGGTGSGTLADAARGLVKGTIAFTTEPADARLLRDAAEAGVSGLIAPSIPASDWVDYCGRETAVALTGDEDIPFTLMLTSGFGRFLMDSECAGFLRSHEGGTAGLSGRTQVRAGSLRPTLVVSD
jgi:hypothetical protein